MNILILFNKIKDANRNDQQDLLMQVNFIENVLQNQGHAISKFACDLNLDELHAHLKNNRPDLVVNLVEELDGRGQLVSFVPTLLENLRIPFTGGSSQTLYLTNNKILAKQLLHHNNLPTPGWYDLHSGCGNFRKGIKYIIKAIHEHASFALDEFSVITPKTQDELVAAIKARENQYKCDFFAEQYIPGREFNTAMIENIKGPELLPIAEMKFVNFSCPENILTYKAKWEETSQEYIGTTRNFDFKAQDKDLIAKLKTLSLNVWKTMNLCGYVRIDFRVDENHNPFILEINANPCLSPDAGFVAAAEQKYKSQTEIVMKIIDATLRRL